MTDIALVRCLTLEKTQQPCPEVWEGEFDGKDIYIRYRHQNVMYYVGDMSDPIGMFHAEHEVDMVVTLKTLLPMALGVDPELMWITWKGLGQ